MADIDLRRKHGLGIKAARAAAEKMSEHLGKKFGLQGEWSGDTLRFERPGVTGALAITEQDLHLTITLGFLLKAMRGSIENAVNGELDQLFAAKAGTKEPPANRDPEAKAKKAPAPKKKGG
jgi:putative polyhydroxyalkanoate system protein